MICAPRREPLELKLPSPCRPAPGNLECACVAWSCQACPLHTSSTAARSRPYSGSVPLQGRERAAVLENSAACSAACSAVTAKAGKSRSVAHASRSVAHALSLNNPMPLTSSTWPLALYDNFNIYYNSLGLSDENWTSILRYATIHQQAHVDAHRVLHMPNWVQWRQQELSSAVIYNDERRVRQLLTRGVLPINGGQQVVLPGHALLVMCVICNRLVMAQIMLREMRENVHSQSMDAAALVAFCVRNNHTEMRQLLMDEGSVWIWRLATVALHSRWTCCPRLTRNPMPHAEASEACSAHRLSELTEFIQRKDLQRLPWCAIQSNMIPMTWNQVRIHSLIPTVQWGKIWSI